MAQVYLVNDGQEVLAADHNSLVKLLTGQAGIEQAVSFTRLSDASNPALLVKNLHASGPQLELRGSDDSKTLKVTGSGSHILHTSSASGVTLQAQTDLGVKKTLSLQTAAGSKVSISQGWTDESVFALEVIKSFRATGALIGSANQTLNQIARDDSTSGGDMTTAKVTQHWSGSNVTVSATARGLEVEAIRYAATSGTGSATTYGAVTAGSMKYGSTRGIDIGVAHDPAITDPAIYTFGLCGLNVFNVGAASVDGKSWGSGGNKGTAGLNIWGAAGFQYGIIYSGPSTPDQLLTTTTGRIFHLRESGGNDGILYQTANTTGTGMRLANGSVGGRSLDIFSVGSAVGAPHTGKMAIYDATGGVYLLSAGMNAADTTKGQVGVIAGTAAYPGLVSYSDLNTGLYWGGTDTLHVSNNGTEQFRFTAAGKFDLRNTQWAATGGGGVATLGGITNGPAGTAMTGWINAFLAGGTQIYIPYWV